MTDQTSSQIKSISPFFIVGNLAESLDYYNTKLGFATDFVVPEDDPFFAIVHRDSARILLKEISPEVQPVPNNSRHEWARWDAFVMVADPDRMYREFETAGVFIHEPIDNTDDGLRAFEVKDNNGYVLCFGCPADPTET